MTPLSRLPYPCPLDGCPWILDPSALPAPVLRFNAPVTDGLNEALEGAVHAMAVQEVAAIDGALRDHLADHDNLDFLRTINRLQQDLAQQGSGIRPHVYPRSTHG